MSFIEGIFFGAIQGISEWLPISSEGLTFLFGIRLIEGISSTELIRLSLYLHLGTFLAALLYLRKEVMSLVKNFFGYRKASQESRAVLNFYIIATLVSGIIGYGLIRIVESIDQVLGPTTFAIILAIGLLLIVTGAFQLKEKGLGHRSPSDAKWIDGVLVGLAQGFAAIPGLSRSGMTVSTLLLRNFDDDKSLKMSFILSLPVILGGNIALGTANFVFTAELFGALVIAFLFGISTIHILLKFAERVRFGWFTIFFGALVLASAFLLNI